MLFCAFTSSRSLSSLNRRTSLTHLSGTEPHARRFGAANHVHTLFEQANIVVGDREMVDSHYSLMKHYRRGAESSLSQGAKARMLSTKTGMSYCPVLVCVDPTKWLIVRR
jgi:hypothetical protein